MLRLSVAASLAMAVLATASGARAEDVACERLEAAHDVDPTAIDTLLQLALCHEEMHRNATAWAEFRQVIVESSGREVHATTARVHEARLAPLLSFVLIRVPASSRAPRMRIGLDGSRSITEPNWGVELPLDPGKHVLEISAPGKVTRQLQIVVGDVADRQTIEVPPLTDIPRPAVAKRQLNGSDWGTVGYVLGGTGIVALSAGLVSGSIAMSRSSDADDAAGYCPSSRCPSEVARARASRAIDEATTYANIANFAISAGIVLIVGGIALISSAKPDSSGRTKPSTLRVTAGGAAFSFGRSW